MRQRVNALQIRLDSVIICTSATFKTSVAKQFVTKSLSDIKPLLVTEAPSHVFFKWLQVTACSVWFYNDTDLERIKTHGYVPS